MRSVVFSLFVTTAALLAACSDGTSSTNNTGGNAGAAGSAGTAGSAAGGSAGSSTAGSAGSSTGGTGGTTTSSTAGSGGTTTSTSTSSNLCDTAGSTPVSFMNDVQPIFSASCGSATTCHLKGIPSEGLSLKVGEAYANLVNVPAKQACNGQVRVEPSSASGSYVVNKITATGICGIEKQMPPGGLLPPATRQTIIDWICQGAQQN